MHFKGGYELVFLAKKGSFRQSIPTHLKSSIIWIFDRVVLLLSFAICVNSFLSIWTWFPILPYFGSFPLGILPILTFFYNFVPLRKEDFISSISQFFRNPLALDKIRIDNNYIIKDFVMISNRHD